jgi:hypothetical protein
LLVNRSDIVAPHQENKIGSALQQCDTWLMKSWRAIGQIVMRGCSGCTLEGTQLCGTARKGQLPNWRHASDISRFAAGVPFLRREKSATNRRA